MPVRSLKDAVVKIADSGGTGGGNVVTVDVEDGTFSYSEHSPVNIISDRGVLDHARLANQEPIDVSMDMKFQSFSTHVSPSPYDAVTFTGGASAWVSDEPNSDVNAVILEIVISDPAGGASETITIPRVAIENIDFAEGDPSDSLTFSGRAVATRATLS